MMYRTDFGPWPPCCQGFETTEFLRGKNVIPKPHTQTAGPAYLLAQQLVQNLPTRIYTAANIAFDFTHACKLLHPAK